MTDNELFLKRKLKRVDLQDPLHRNYECPICGNGKVHIENSVYYGRCDQCEATIIDFEPLEHQAEYFTSPATYKLLIGGFASGKTTIASLADAYHCMTTPNGRVLITAPTLQQLKQAILPELEKFLPPWFLVGGKAKGNPPVYTLTNGSEILCYASDDETKLRSLNLTRFHIEEGSGVPKTVFDQLTARLRNHAGIIYDEHGLEVGGKFSGDISTNPEDSWVVTDFLLKSARIHGSRSVDTKVYKNIMASKREPEFESFLSASFDNVKLPKGTIERISAGKSDRWKRKYLWCYLDTKEGLVYPDLPHHYVEPFQIPDSWVRIGGYDPGISDPTACLIGAIDPKDNTIYFYDEYYVTDKTISYHGDQLKNRINKYKWFGPMKADPSVNKRSSESLVTYKSYFKQITGITLKTVNNDILYGIDKVRDYLYNGKIKVFNNLENFKKEASLYAFPDSSMKETNVNNKPIDKWNHLMDCLRYSIVELPNNPVEFRGVTTQSEVLKKHSSAFKKDTSIPMYEGGTTDHKFNKIVYGFRRG